MINTASYSQPVLKPFPQHVKYNNGVINPSNASPRQMDDSVCSFYKKWKGRYVRNAATPGQYYIWVENTVDDNECVSEGQGYGMMITALMAGYDKEAQKIYNGLYRYFKAHPSKNNPYLMAWAQTKSFKDVDGTSASDGDIDIAYSLLVANAQWGSSGNINYLKEAQLMIAAIKKQEINPETFSVLLSNAVEPDSKDYYDTRSSDFMPAHFKAFGKATKDNFWNKVVDKNYTLFKFLQNEYSPDAGLVPDFIEHIKRKPGAARPHYLESKYDGAYNYNACRVPWRIATDFLINGDQRSKEFVEKINTWIKETTQNNPDNISAGYTLGGDDIKNRYYEAMSFIASFTVAAMISSQNQDWLNKLWDYVMSFNLDQFDYYGNTIKMISMIILSGNYWAP
ncbi:MAG: glycosyl hydrolase family 8 [Ginsengibacter sp.]